MAKSSKKDRNIPSKIKIGCFNYSVIKNNNMMSNEIGQTKVDKLVIELNPIFPDEILRETLLHECLHAILNDTFIIDDEVEEKIIRVLSPKIMQMMEDNKDLVDFLFKKI